jgi:hypothetical protein
MSQYGAMVSSKNIWGFDPTSIGGCTLWLDGADPNTMFSDAAGAVQSAIGDPVALWRNKSVSGGNIFGTITVPTGATGATASGGAVTLTLASNPSVFQGTSVTIANVEPTSLRGTYTVTAVSGNTITFPNSTTATSVTTAGTLTIANNDAIGAIRSATSVVATGAVGSTGTISYSVNISASNTLGLGMLVGNSVTTTGISPTTFNVENAVISSITQVTAGVQYTIVVNATGATGTATSGGLMTFTNTKFPTRAANSVSFSGSEYLALPNPSLLPRGATNSTRFVVCRTSDTTTRQTIFNNGSNANGGSHFLQFNVGGSSPAPSNSYFLTNAFPTPFSGTQAISDLHMITGQLDNFIQAGWHNGNSYPSNNNGDTQLLTTGANVGSAFSLIGGDILAPVSPFTANSRYLNGNISEILVFNSALSNTDRQTIEGYLAWKWGLQSALPASHPYNNQIRPFSRNFVPTDIPDCIMWFDGADLTSMFTNVAGTTGATGTGSIIRHWRDKSGSGNNLTNAATGPTLTTSANPRGFDMVFNGTNSFLSKTDVVNNSNTYTKFLVFNRPGTGAGFARLFAYGSVGGGESLANDPTGFHIQEGNVGSIGCTVYKSATNSLFNVSNNTYHVITIVANPLSMQLFLNGALTSTAILTLPNTNFNGTGFFLGTRYNAIFQFFPGFINEVISYNRQLSTYEYQEVEGYLAWKWGLRNSLPTAHPFYRFPTPSTTPIQPELQLYKNTFDPSDLNPVIWIDPKDNTTITKDTTTSRITAIVNKGSYSATFTPPTAGTGTGISGPLVTTATTGSSLGQQFLDFSNGGNYQVTSVTVGASPFTQLTLTVSPPHNGAIPVGAFVNFTAHNGTYLPTATGLLATRTIGPFQILSATVSGGTTLTITTISGHGIGNSESIFLTINTGTFLGGVVDASTLTGAYTTAAAGNSGSTIVIPIASSTNGIMAIPDGHVRNNVGTTGPYITQAGTTGSTVILTSYSPRAAAGAISNFTGRIEYGQIPFTSGILTSTTSMTLRTPINHGLSSGTAVGISMNNVATLPFQSPLPTTGTTLNAASVQFTSATVAAGGTTLTITVTTNPFFINSGTPNYVGLSPIRLTLLAGTNFNGGTSATGISTFGLVTQTGSNATTIVLTIPSSPAGALTFNALPGMLISDQSTGSNSFRLNSTQTLSAGTSGNTIVIPVPLYTQAITGRILERTTPSWNSNIQNVSLLFPLNGYAIELTSMGSALTTNRATIVWVSCLATNLSRNNPTSSAAQSPVLSTAVSLNGDGGADTFNGGRDYKLIAASFAGNASRLGIFHGNTATSFFLGTFTDGVSQFRVNSAVINLTASTAGDVGPNVAGVSTFGWRYSNQLRNTSYSVQIGGRQTNNLAPSHLRIGANTNATTNYTTHPLAGQWYEGGVGDILIFNSILTAEQRQLVEGYLAQKYTCQTYLGLTSTTSNTTAGYAIASGSVSGSGPYTITLGGIFTTAFINGSQITIAGASPGGLNNTWTLTLASTTQVQFYSDVSYTWSFGGTITGITANNANFIHPYRANMTSISSSSNLTQIHTQGLAFWYDAANASTINGGAAPSDGGNVTSWEPSGGWLGLTLTGGGGSVFPTYQISAQNNLPAIRFPTFSTNAANLYYNASVNLNSVSSNSSYNPEYTIFVAFKTARTPASFANFIIDFGAINLAISDGAIYSNGVSTFTAGYTPTINVPCFVTLRQSGNRITVRLNGLQTVSDATVPLSGTILTSYSRFIIGSRNVVDTTSTNAFVGDLYETAMFRYGLTNQAIFQIEGYLAWKWGLQTALPTTHPYYKIRP